MTSETRLIMLPADSSPDELRDFLKAIRQEDLKEASFSVPEGGDIRHYLFNHVKTRHQPLIAMSPDGQTPLCLFGCEPHDACGVPWLLCTEAVKGYRKEVLTECRSYVDRWTTRYGHLCNVTWAGNPMHQKLIRALGFTINTDEVLTINNGDFHYFEKRTKTNYV